jgi:hypothetical protein
MQMKDKILSMELPLPRQYNIDYTKHLEKSNFYGFDKNRIYNGDDINELMTHVVAEERKLDAIIDAYRNSQNSNV